MGKPVLIDFYAIWCEPCRFLGPVIEEFARRMGDRVEVKQINVDNHMEMANKYRIYVVPTLIIEKDAKVMQQIEGVGWHGPLLRVFDTRVNDEEMKAISFMGFRSVEEFLDYQNQEIKKENEWKSTHTTFRENEWGGLDPVVDWTGFEGETLKWRNGAGFRSQDEWIRWAVLNLEGIMQPLVEKP